ncbi:hypothetical protein [Marinilabilia rubra]|uniref:WG repeat-containing protein n=1 Tax=Marinilabilia rubra TaxID=2162893 RepID=A0A2U2B5F4_9BACT|nr:hypothetical protein [Marinilabilia rubra]PWD98263.1 hypothetical protein DDZ16_16660 [Marinilabilia rubra]
MKAINCTKSKTKITHHIIFLKILIASLSINTYGQVAKDSLLNLATTEIGILNFKKADLYLTEVEEKDSLNPRLLYLRAEMKLFQGEGIFLNYLEKIKKTGKHNIYNLMKLKHAVFIGLSEADSLIQNYLANYPENGEVNLMKWLLELDKGNFEHCKKTAKKISSETIFKFLPYLALHNSSWDRNYQNAIFYMDYVEQIIGKEFYGSKYREILGILSKTKTAIPENGNYELPFASCGPGVGFYMIDEKGDSLKIEIDTGTGYNMMTVHDKSLGKSISGSDILVTKNGISYNYMDKPADLHYKKAILANPPYKNLIFGYFDGRFSKADGCSSPFIFKNRAIHIDPQKEEVWLLDYNTLQNYISENQDEIVKVPYIVRNGWIFIPCKVNGKEVLMQLETGSRDICFNSLSLKALNLESYSGAIEWNGKDYPIDKVDCVLEIGRIKYQVEGGLVIKRIPNWYYGLASAGDIGPVFMNNFAYTIDVFNQQIIFKINR